GVIGATYCARDGICDPNGVTQGFAKAAQSAGAHILRETEATGIRVEGGRVAGVGTSRGVISTRRVVNAAGPWARDVGGMAGVEVPVQPYRRHIFITEAIASLNAAGGVAVPPSHIMVIDFESTFYFHREGGGVLFGMSDASEPSSHDTS